jgi:hypothetical protein
MSKRNNQTRQDFLHTFFDGTVGYEEKQVNGYWLVKHLVAGGPRTEVAIYSPEKYKTYKWLASKKRVIQPDRSDELTATEKSGK